MMRTGMMMSLGFAFGWSIVGPCHQHSPTENAGLLCVFCWWFHVWLSKVLLGMGWNKHCKQVSWINPGNLRISDYMLNMKNVSMGPNRWPSETQTWQSMENPWLIDDFPSSKSLHGQGIVQFLFKFANMFHYLIYIYIYVPWFSQQNCPPCFAEYFPHVNSRFFEEMSMIVPMDVPIDFHDFLIFSLVFR